MTKELSFHLITVCGGSASGKSLVIKETQKKFSEKQLCIIPMDDYYKALEFQHKDEKGIYNFDLPQSIDHNVLIDELYQLSEGKQVDRFEYTYNHPDKVPQMKHFYPAPVVIVEGLFALWFDKLRALTNFSVFIEAEEQVCYTRRKNRDINERGISEEIFEHQWNNHVLPAYSKYLQPFKQSASLIINNNNDCQNGVYELVNHINLVLGLQ